MHMRGGRERGGGSRVSSHGCKRGTRQDTMVIGNLGRLVIDVGGLSPFFLFFSIAVGNGRQIFPKPDGFLHRSSGPRWSAYRSYCM